MTSPCVNVRVACKERPSVHPTGLVISEIGQDLGWGKVIFAKPLPCVVTPVTSIQYVHLVNISTKELRNNILITLNYGEAKDYLIYPKDVWFKVRDDFFERIRAGDAPREPGLILYGPPGTGKTSMLNLLADSLGLYTVTITPDYILSKYVGESEERLSKAFREAEAMEPSLVKMDDAEWITMSRELNSLNPQGMATLTLMNILLNNIEEWGKKRKRVFIGVTTNATPTKIMDSALLRAGRAEEPIFIPLPDYEAVTEILRILGLYRKVGVEKAEEYARKFINMGANMKNIRRYVQDILMGREPTFKDIEGRGYVRPMPHKLHTDIADVLEGIVPKFAVMSPHARLYVAMPRYVGEAFAVNYSLAVGKPPVLVTDSRFVDEALMTADVSKAVLIVDHQMMPQQVINILHSNAKVPIMYIGDAPPKAPFRVLVDYSTVKARGRELLTKMVLDYYGVKYDAGTLRRTLHMTANKLDLLLQEVALWARGVELKEIIKYYV